MANRRYIEKNIIEECNEVTLWPEVEGYNEVQQT